MLYMKNIFKFLYGVSMILIVAFAIIVGVDYSNYNTFENSAPFYSLVLVRILEFIVPSVIIFVVSKVLKKKYLK